MSISPRDQAALWALAIKQKDTLARSSEAMIERFYRAWVQPGDTVVDVGANVGRHLFPLAQCVGAEGKLLAYEPIPDLSTKLAERLAAVPEAGWVKLQAMAISDKAGTSSFHYIQAAPALSGLMRRNGLPTEPLELLLTVETDTLDRQLDGLNPSFIKIDVEGGEFNVMQGATGLMRRCAPVFAFEDGRSGSAALYGYTMDEFYNFFEMNEYVVLDMFGWQVTSVMNSFPGPWNFYAVPKAKVAVCATLIAYAMEYELWSLVPA